MISDAVLHSKNAMELLYDDKWWRTPDPIHKPKPPRNFELGVTVTKEQQAWAAGHALLWHRKARSVKKALKASGDTVSAALGTSAWNTTNALIEDLIPGLPRSSRLSNQTEDVIIRRIRALGL